MAGSYGAAGLLDVGAHGAAEFHGAAGPRGVACVREVTGAAWTGAAWTGAAWTGAAWTGAAWTGAAWTAGAPRAEVAWAAGADGRPGGRAGPGLDRRSALPPGNRATVAGRSPGRSAACSRFVQPACPGYGRQPACSGYGRPVACSGYGRSWGGQAGRSRAPGHPPGPARGLAPGHPAEPARGLAPGLPEGVAGDRPGSGDRPRSDGQTHCGGRPRSGGRLRPAGWPGCGDRPGVHRSPGTAGTGAPAWTYQPGSARPPPGRPGPPGFPSRRWPGPGCSYDRTDARWSDAWPCSR